MQANLIELIKQLRERTGAGMMDAKKALESSDLDLDKAVDWLREKGIVKSQAKASRIAAEGLCLVDEATKNGRTIAGIIEINSETDFVAKSDKFVAMSKKILGTVIKEEPKELEVAQDLVKDLLADATMIFGEKVHFRRCDVVTLAADEVLGTYVHMNGKIAAIVVMKHAKVELAKGLAMHIAAFAPKYSTLQDIPKEEIERERGIQLELAKSDEKLRSKPAEALAKIIDGKINKLFSETVLASQPYVMEQEKTVSEVLKEHGATVVKFIRYGVGEGIEKRQDDFAAEVNKQAGLI
ncbi:MAG: translation elongation factor Ts [Erysipelotrichaceae bacterium]|jgi:elongation factor Ts|nr:translation elongation factor Ts [Erysipelotrichaceae bacterium]